MNEIFLSLSINTKKRRALEWTFVKMLQMSSWPVVMNTSSKNDDDDDDDFGLLQRGLC